MRTVVAITAAVATALVVTSAFAADRPFRRSGRPPQTFAPVQASPAQPGFSPLKPQQPTRQIEVQAPSSPVIKSSPVFPQFSGPRPLPTPVNDGAQPRPQFSGPRPLPTPVNDGDAQPRPRPRPQEFSAPRPGPAPLFDADVKPVRPPVIAKPEFVAPRPAPVPQSEATLRPARPPVAEQSDDTAALKAIEETTDAPVETQQPAKLAPVPAPTAEAQQDAIDGDAVAKPEVEAQAPVETETQGTKYVHQDGSSAYETADGDYGTQTQYGYDAPSAYDGGDDYAPTYTYSYRRHGYGQTYGYGNGCE